MQVSERHSNPRTWTLLPTMSYGKPFFMKATLLDVGWATFTEIVSARAARAGRVVVFVNSFKTSQLCSGCGAEVKKDLSELWYSYDSGAELDRDTNAALNILKSGHKALSGGTRSTSATA